MRKELQNSFTWLVNKVSASVIYENWSDDLKLKEMKDMYEIFYDFLKTEVDLTKLTVEEAKELGFKKWSEEEEDVRDLWLFPLYMTPIIPEGFEVTFIDGEKGNYEKDKMDNDIRFGCVAYGIIIKEKGE